MSKYKNKRLHVTAFDVVFAVIFLGLLIASAFFWSEHQETKGKFNIEQTKVDYIIEAPSREQVSEISTRNDVDKIVPYVYKSVDVKGRKKSINSGMYIIENADDLGYTVFSDELRIGETISSNNPLYVSADLAQKAGLSVNDTITIQVLGNPIEFTISGIFKSDYRNVGGTSIAIMSAELKDLCGNDYRYNGAFICSNDLTATKSYVDKYVGMGDLRSADEFDSEEAYQQYLENRKNKSSSESTFFRADYISELNKRYKSKLNRDFIVSLACILGAMLFLFIDLFGKPSSYTKNDVEKDIRNNFTLKQEKQMYGHYSFGGFIMYAIACIIYLVISFFLLGNDLISINTITVIAATVLFAVITRTMSISKLNKYFSLVAERIKKMEAKVTD